MKARVKSSGDNNEKRDADSLRTTPGKFTPSEKKWVETVLEQYKKGDKTLKERMVAMENFIIEAESRAIAGTGEDNG